jgi:hypothetical protein
MKRTMYEHGKPVTVLIVAKPCRQPLNRQPFPIYLPDGSRWTGRAPLNVLIRRLDGTVRGELVVRPYRGLRRTAAPDSWTC